MKTQRNQSAKGSKNSSKCLYATAVTSLVISSVCVVCVGLFLVWFFVLSGNGENWPNTASHSARMSGGEARVCLPCLQVSPNPLDDEGRLAADVWKDLEVIFENDTQICCAANTAQYAALFKLVSRDLHL
jgi:hypothetical protein